MVPAVDRVLSFVITERSPFALLAGLVGGPSFLCQGGNGTFDMINKRLIYAKPSCVVTPKSACNDIQANCKPLGASTIVDCTQMHTARPPPMGRGAWPWEASIPNDVPNDITGSSAGPTGPTAST